MTRTTEKQRYMVRHTTSGEVFAIEIARHREKGAVVATELVGQSVALNEIEQYASPWDIDLDYDLDPVAAPFDWKDYTLIEDTAARTVLN